MPRKRRVRLSFRGGRRPSLLPIKRPLEENKENNDEEEENLTNDFQITLMPMNNDKLHADKELKKHEENKESIIDIDEETPPMEKNSDKQLSKNKNKTTRRRISSSKDNELQIQDDLKSKQLLLSNKLEENLVLNEKYKTQLLNEIEKWKELLSIKQQENIPFCCENIDLPDDIKELVSFDSYEEQDYLQKLLKDRQTQIVQIKKEEHKLNILKELSMKNLITKQDELHSGDVNSETPRHLIKAIIQK